MDRNLDREAAVILNDLDSMVHRIEMLQANSHYTRALTLVQDAFTAIGSGRSEIHHAEMRARFAKAKAL